MKHKEIKFDELDIHVIDNFPTIIDSITSTFSRLERLFQPFYEDLLVNVNDFLQTNRNFEIYEKWNPEYTPFNIYPKTKEIKSLENLFQFYYGLSLREKRQKKIMSTYEIYFGFYSDDTDNENYKFFNFALANLNPIKHGIANDLKFYKNIESEVTEFKLQIEHPELGSEIEHIQLEVDHLDPKDLQMAYEIYKVKVLLPFLKNCEKTSK